MSPTPEEVWIIDDEERRIAPRTEAGGWVVSAPVPGQIVNHSDTGIALATTESLPIGESLMLNIDDGSNTREVSGLVRWCRLVCVDRGVENQLRPKYLSGIAFGN